MPMVWPWDEVICPFCFHHFHLSEAPWRLLSGPEQEDPKVGQFLGIPDPPPMWKVEPSPASRGRLHRLFHLVFIPDDAHVKKRKICPECHMILPHGTATGQLKSDTIAIIGARSTGKSNYFGVLLHELENRYAHEVGFRLHNQETFSVDLMKPISSHDLYVKRYSSLYQPGKRQAIELQTSRAEINPDARIPLIYRLVFAKQFVHHLPRFLPFAKINAMDLVIFDTAGEDMGNRRAWEQYYPFIMGASGIIFLLDPCQVLKIREKLPKDLLGRVSLNVDNPSSIIDAVWDMFQHAGKLDGDGNIAEIPVAFALSKVDVLKKFLPATAKLFQDSNHNQGFDIEDSQAVSKEIQRYLAHWGERSILGKANTFKNHDFFGFSALGQTPDEDGHIDEVAPHRVADPLLWVLWKLGYIRGV